MNSDEQRGGSPGEAWRRPKPAVSVLAAPSDHVLARSTDPTSLLTATEQQRADRFRFERDRRDFIAAHVLARVAAGRVLGLEPRSLTLVQRCAECGQAHGRPAIAERPELGVSLSHTRGYVAAVVGPGQVGVDAQAAATASRPDEGLQSAVLAPNERVLVSTASNEQKAFIRLWTRKEAMVKFGRGSLDDLSAMDFSSVPLADLSSGPACTSRWKGFFLLEWQDAEWHVLGAAVTTNPPAFALLGGGHIGAEFRDIPVVRSASERRR